MNRRWLPLAMAALLVTAGAGSARPAKDRIALRWSTYLAGSGRVEGIAVDRSGNVYVVGLTGSPDFPTTDGAYQTEMRGDDDGFVAKLDRGGDLVWATYFGGEDTGDGVSIAVDGSGATYITGSAGEDPTFPTTAGAAQTASGGMEDAFIAKLSPDGSQLVYSTYLGGNDIDRVEDLAIDGDGAAYVVGVTLSDDFPTVAAEQSQHAGDEEDAFVTKVSPDGSSFEYSTYLGGSANDWARAVTVDDRERACVGIESLSSDFPLTTGLGHSGRRDATVVRLEAGGEIDYARMVGGSRNEYVGDIAVRDGSYKAYVVGRTESNDYFLKRPLDRRKNDVEGFLFKLNASGEDLQYSTYLGGRRDDDPQSAIVNEGGIFIAGTTRSSDFPTKRAYQRRKAGNLDAFVMRVATGGRRIEASTYIGGRRFDSILALELRGPRNAFIAGSSEGGWPTKNAFDERQGGGPIVARLRFP